LPKSILRGILTGLCIVALPCFLLAQDAQYWNVHYGTKGVLLSGAIIGSVDDVSAIFYNPGFLGLAAKPGLSVGTGLFEVSRTAVRGANSEPADRIVVSSSPGLVAGQVQFDDDKDHHWTYGVLGRQNFSTILQSRSVRPFVGINGDTGTATREVYLFQDQSEYWGGASFATKLSNNLGVGVTVFGALRTQRRRNEVHTDGLLKESTFSVGLYNGFQYFAIRTLAKFGLYWRDTTTTWGITATLPSVHLFGIGRAYTTEAILNANVVRGDQQDRLAFFDDNNKASRYRSPLSIGIGASQRMGNLRIHGSAEWFNGVAPFSVIDTKPQQADEFGTLRQNIVQEQLRSVINIGVGVEITVSDKLSWYGSVITDFSAVDLSATTTLALSTWDIYHASGGALFTLGAFKITAGLGLAHGTSNEFPRSKEQTTELAIFGERGETTMEWLRVRALIGLEYAIN
jgi:hypothetical protein